MWPPWFNCIALSTFSLGRRIRSSCSELMSTVCELSPVLRKLTNFCQLYFNGKDDPFSSSLVRLTDSLAGLQTPVVNCVVVKLIVGVLAQIWAIAGLSYFAIPHFHDCTTAAVGKHPEVCEGW